MVGKLENKSGEIDDDKSDVYDGIYASCFKGYPSDHYWGSMTNHNLEACLYEWIDKDKDTKILKYKSLHRNGIDYNPCVYSDVIERYVHSNDYLLTKHYGIGCARLTFPVSGHIKFLCPISDLIDYKKQFKIDDNAEILEYKYSIEEQKKSETYFKEMLQKEHQQRIDEEKKILKDKIIENKRKRTLEKQALQELIDEGKIFPEANKRKAIQKEIADAVWNRDGGKCVYCGSTENLHFDHIIPFSKGGATNVENLQLLCQKCNIEKSNKIG